MTSEPKHSYHSTVVNKRNKIVVKNVEILRIKFPGFLQIDSTFCKLRNPLRKLHSTSEMFAL